MSFANFSISTPDFLYLAKSSALYVSKTSVPTLMSGKFNWLIWFLVNPLLVNELTNVSLLESRDKAIFSASALLGLLPDNKFWTWANFLENEPW